jgi:hypothetical protein
MGGATSKLFHFAQIALNIYQTCVRCQCWMRANCRAHVLESTIIGASQLWMGDLASIPGRFEKKCVKLREDKAFEFELP